MEDSHRGDETPLETPMRESEDFLTCLTRYIEQPNTSKRLPTSNITVNTTWRDEETEEDKLQRISRSSMAELTDRMRDIWIFGAEMEMATEAMRKIGLEPRVTEMTSDDLRWKDYTNLPNLYRVRQKTNMNLMKTTDEWLILLDHSKPMVRNQKQKLEFSN
jgi:hypothetical protein